MKGSTALALICLSTVGCTSSPTTFPGIDERYTLAVNYDRSIEDSVRAGSYGWFSKDITSASFRSTESGLRQVSMQLVELPKYTTIERIIELQKQNGLRPATIKELLSFAEKYPAVQLGRIIVALGSTCSVMVEDKPDSTGIANPMQPQPDVTPQTRMVPRTYWPYLSSQGSMRILSLGQVSRMIKDPFERPLACFVLME